LAEPVAESFAALQQGVTRCNGNAQEGDGVRGGERKAIETLSLAERMPC
jgi:hypothetical protein